MSRLFIALGVSVGFGVACTSTDATCEDKNACARDEQRFPRRYCDGLWRWPDGQICEGCPKRGADGSWRYLDGKIWSEAGAAPCTDIGDAGFGGDSSASGGSIGSGGATSSSGAGGENDGGSGGFAAGGTGGLGPCNGVCAGKMPVCDESSDSCVECTERKHCAAPKPACDPANKTCVECAVGTDCKAPTPVCNTDKSVCVECMADSDCADKAAKKFCETTKNICVECLGQADCKHSPSASLCDEGVCKPCSTNAHCKDVLGAGVCDGGLCVECTGKDYGACGKDSTTQKPLVCDSLKRTCSKTNKEHDAGLCKTCISDAQCAMGQLCVLQKFGSPSEDVGYFCQWRKGDTANGAPADCFASGRPYVGTVADALSIDKITADICVLRASTCAARNQFSSKDCKPAASPDDTLCGFDGPTDAKCALVPLSSSYRCSMRCLSSDDCPGTACDDGVAQPYCKLQ